MDEIGKGEKLGSGKATSSKLKGGMTTMEDILEQQASAIQSDVESVMDGCLRRETRFGSINTGR